MILTLSLTRTWSNLIDRGGLFHISDEVAQLFESIEMVVRRHLEVSHVSSQSSDTSYGNTIIHEVLRNESILEQWERIACSVPLKYERYSVELLNNITRLWTTVRGNSFAKGWTMNFVKRYSKGIRKTLKN